MTENAAREIVAFLSEYNKHFVDMQRFLARKMQKVVDDDVSWLLDSLAEEQRLVMKGNAIEENRLKMMERLGLAGKDSKALLEQVPEAFRGRLSLELDSMKNSIDRIKKLSDDVLDLIDRKLQVQAKYLRDKGMLPGDTYNGTGGRVHSKAGSTVLGNV